MVIKRILLPFCDDGDVKPIAEAAFQLGRTHCPGPRPSCPATFFVAANGGRATLCGNDPASS